MAAIIHSRNKSLEQQLVEAAGDSGPIQDQKTHNKQKEELSAELQTLQENFERKDNQVREIEAKLKALNLRVVIAVAEKVENFMRVQELEDNIRLLTQDNLDLQEKFLHSPVEMTCGSQNYIESVSDIAGLKKLMANIESSWEQRNKILKAIRSEKKTRKQVKNDLKEMEKKQKELQLLSQQWETSESHDQHELMVKKEELISLLTGDKEALEDLALEKEAQLMAMKEQVIQSEAEWKNKLAALENQLRSEVASKEETIREMKRNNREMVRQWDIRVSQMEEAMQLQTEETNDLQAQILILQELHHTASLKEAKTAEMVAKKERKKKREREGRRGDKIVQSFLSSLFKLLFCFPFPTTINET